MIAEEQVRSALARLSGRARAELLSKDPHWGDAVLCDGLIFAACASGSSASLNAAREWFQAKLAQGPRLQGWFWFWSAEALAALDLAIATGDTRALTYARSIVDAFQSAPVCSGVISPHPPAREAWIDVAYFTAPAAARLARLRHDVALMRWALHSLLAHQRCLLDENTGLFWHVAYLDRGGHSPCLWARGNSWYSIAATEVLNELRDFSEADFATEIGEVKSALTRQLNAIVRLQAPGGRWHTVIDRSDSYLESSATAGFALALGRALRVATAGLDSVAARLAYERAIEAVCGQINDVGELIGVSQQTPPGDFNFYNSVDVGTAPFGTGVALMALSEALNA